MKCGYKKLLIRGMCTCCSFSLFLILSGCTLGEMYNFHLFSFPPGSEPHEHNWEYSGSVTFYYRSSFYNNESKRIAIVVKDTTGKKYLDDVTSLTCANVNVKIKWDVFDTLQFLFYNPDIGEPVKVLVNGAIDSTYENVLMQLNYHYNSTANMFER